MFANNGVMQMSLGPYSLGVAFMLSE